MLNVDYTSIQDTLDEAFKCDASQLDFMTILKLSVHVDIIDSKPDLNGNIFYDQFHLACIKRAYEGKWSLLPESIVGPFEVSPMKSSNETALKYAMERNAYVSHISNELGIRVPKTLNAELVHRLLCSKKGLGDMFRMIRTYLTCINALDTYGTEYPQLAV